ncbi:glyoxalase [Shewanella sp. 10N.286.51.B7]|uniref:VOC family protein n=1 Tax=Shewanella sp. 10N.286.51.B7 TaxID=1880836 RepID=UPI000C8586B1|nr:VOC family protein [Shewanella sp. 10N.286.51.B7]PMG76661.1 glyoxalase [Shewanella sp. 10N.286.51.B7]
MRLNQITIPVNDMAKACEFYLTLGFTQIVSTAADGNHYARFACPEGEATFSLSFLGGESLQGSDSIQKRENSSVIYFEHQDLDVWVEALIQQGIIFEQLPVDESYLWCEAVLFDPSGNKIKLYWAGENRLNPPWRVNIKQ